MKTLRVVVFRIFTCRVSLLMLCLWAGNGRVFAQNSGIPQTIGNKLTGTAIVNGATVDAICASQGEKAATSTGVVSFNITEENAPNVPNFTASVTVDIAYGNNAASTTTLSGIVLTVNYSKDAGVSYDTKKYISIPDARYIKATLVSTPSGLSDDIVSLLVLKSEIQATLYFDLNPNLVPLSFKATPQSSGTDIPDELPVTWCWPPGALNNGTQLEWTFVPGDISVNYLNGDGSPNYDLIFRNNSTRVDLPMGVMAYNVPLFYDGLGKIYYRIRAVNYLPSGSQTDGPWTNGTPITFDGHNQALNWQVNTVFAEDGKRKTVMQYYDGSLRLRQTVTKDNSTNTTLTAETFYDGQGRPAIQILPAPGIDNIVAYHNGLNLFNSPSENLPSSGLGPQGIGTDPAAYFDLQDRTANNATPPLQNTANGTAQYYNSTNPEIGLNNNGNLPDAGGYPYTVTRYTPDATNRIMTQSGVGPAMRMTSGHEARYFYGNATQEQLDGLFGPEVGIAPHYFKNMVQDANGQMSISYVDMHGRTIATSLAGTASSSLAALDLSQYPGQQFTRLTQNLLPAGANLVKGNSIEALNSLLVPVGDDYDFTYTLTPDALSLQNCQGTQNICYDCMYDLEIRITDESGDTPPFIRKFANVTLASANACPPDVPFLTANGGNAISTPSGSQISFSQHLNAGSYSIRKTLTVSDVAKASLRDQYIATALCNTEQGIIDSLYTVLAAQTQCAAPKPACTTCGQHTLDIIQAEMLADMTPFDGQYAQDPTASGTLSASFQAWNIFTTSRYKVPSGGFYLDANGQNDPNATTVSNMTPAVFDGVFAPSWANQLLPYHPEYHELQYALQRLPGSYEFIETFNDKQSYDPIYNDPETQDPFFTSVASPATAGYIHGLSAVGGYYNKLSLWQMAYGSVMCTGNPDPQTVQNCYISSPVNPGTWPSSLTTDQKNNIWNVYKGLYTTVRDSLVSVNIHTNGNPPDVTTLTGFTLRFPVGIAQVPVPADFPGYPVSATNDPNVDLAAMSTAAQQRQCNSYVDRWQASLSQCPTLAARIDKTDILNEMTTRMVAVCERGQDAANPFGSSSVAPANIIVGGDNSFEDVINNVLLEKSIPVSQLCNPFAIDFPKPYGKNPQIHKEYMSVVDKCACDRFAALKTEAGVSTFAELNIYLMNKYGDVLTQVEYDAMANCSIIGTTPCKSVPYNGKLVNGACSCPVDSSIQGAAKYFRPAISLPDSTGGSDSTSCICHQQICSLISVYPLSSPQPKPAFLDCGFSGYNHCVTCSQLSALTTEFKTLFNTQNCAAAPILGSTDLTSDQIGYNMLFAQFVNYRTGLQLDWMTYLAAATGTGCDLAQANPNASQTVVCGNAKPLDDASDLVETEDPCQKTHQMAAAMGHDIYQQRVQQVQQNFDAWYSAKCLSTAETFTVNFATREFHYTLYYYDQAGNLVKTVPPKGVRPDFSVDYINSVEKARTTQATVLPPAHILTTDYRYNSLNLVTAQHTPDANSSSFWYDNLGRLVVSQNAQQTVDHKYSYTIYDEISRIKEVGQKQQEQIMGQSISQSPSGLTAWLTGSVGTREQVTSTFYDKQADWMDSKIIYGVNLRNRVSYTTTQGLITDGQWNATLYSYDVHGNVDTVVQDYGGVSNIDAASHYKRITYDYDLVSNKVNGVDYQHGLGDAFYHRYRYDAENRLVQVLTSRDSIFWEQEAAYDYYKHGPLARTVLGQLQTQELRYSYTLQGWLKGVNSGGLFNYVPPSGGTSDGSSCAPGTFADDLVISSRPVSGGQAVYEARNSITFEEGFGTSADDAMSAIVDPSASACIFQQPVGTGGIIPTDPLSFPIAQDAYNFSLHYYPGDYTPISATTPVTGVLEAIPSEAAPLYNGNIAAMAVNLPTTGSLPLTTAGAMVYNYHYDQLNRLVAMDAFDGLNTASHTFTPMKLDTYGEQVKYDPNGNILKYLRYGSTHGTPAMDDLTYNYNDPATNQLSSVGDNASGSYTTDIKGTTNYQYDKIGNIILEGSNPISWTVYGKILTQSGSTGQISYAYDAGSNRITKTTSSGTTLYVRDAQGNVLSTYQRGVSGNFAQTEVDLYGSSRLGMTRAPAPPTQTITLANGGGTAYVSSFTRGLKSYELSNHLGNVLVTITDKKIPVSSGGSSLIDYYKADVVTAQDYYPFGMIMPGRSFVAAGAGNYRYGFNGKENDNEVKGVGDQIDYGMRVYDPRIGKFLSVDPLREKYPWLSPYQFAENDVIRSIDLDGLEKQIAINGSVVTGPVNIDAVNASILSNHTKSEQAAMKQAAAERYIQEFARRSPQQIAPPSSSDRVESTETALFRRNLNDPDNIGGQAAFTIAQDLHDGRASFKEGDWGNGTISFLNAAINTVTLIGAGPALGAKVKTEIKVEPWHSATDGNYVGSLANRLGKSVLAIDVDYNFSGGAGDVDILTAGFNVEVKSGGKMKLTQSLKNMEYAKSQGQEYILFMPEATTAQIKEAGKKAVPIIKNESELKKKLGAN